MHIGSIGARLRLAAIAVLIVSHGHVGGGEQTAPPDASIERLERLQAAVRDAETDPQERRRAREALIELRRTLIDGHPDDPQRAWWLADQAEDLLLGVLPAEGASLATLVGVPTRAQRELVAATAAEALELLDAAASGFVTLDRRAASRPEIDDVERRILQRRYAAQRETRLAMLRGIADLLRAQTLDDGVTRETLRRAAAETFETLAARLRGAGAARAATYAGLARWTLGDESAARPWFERAVATDDAHSSDRFVSELGLAAIGDGGSTLRALADRYDDPSLLRYRVLIADQEHLQALRSSDAEATRLRRAVGAYERLLDSASAAPLDALRTLVLDKLATTIPDGIAADVLPPLARVARATRLRESGHAGEAVELLEAMLGSDALEAPVRGAALLALGRALLESGRRGEAVDRWGQLARDLPADPSAETAVRLAATVAAAEWATRPHDSTARDRLRSTLALLLDRYPNLPDLDRWRLLAGRLALAEEHFDDARTHFEAVGRDADEWLDAQYEAVAAMKSAWDAADRVERVELTPPLLRRAEQLDRTLAQAGDARESVGRYAALTRALIAELQLEQGRPLDALATLGATAGGPNAMSADVLGAEVRVRLAAAGHPEATEQAFADLAALAASDPEQMRVVLTPLVRERVATVERLLGEGRVDEARAIASRELGRLADLLVEVTAGAGAAVSDAPTRLAVADALRLAGRCDEALPRYERLLAAEPDALPHLLGRAECLFASGGDDELAAAIAIFKRIATIGPQRGGDAYWRAQLRTLQILDRVGRNRHRIVPQIERLRRLDPELGGERWRQGFERLARAVRERDE